MIVTIALAPGVPSYRQRTVLDGVEYVLELRWSEREGRWYFDLRDANGHPLIVGMKLVPNWPLLYRFRSVEGLPPGELMVLTAWSPASDPRLDELGATVRLAYVSREEIADLFAGRQ